MAVHPKGEDCGLPRAGLSAQAPRAHVLVHVLVRVLALQVGGLLSLDHKTYKKAEKG